MNKYFSFLSNFSCKFSVFNLYLKIWSPKYMRAYFVNLDVGHIFYIFLKMKLSFVIFSSQIMVFSSLREWTLFRPSALGLFFFKYKKKVSFSNSLLFSYLYNPSLILRRHLLFKLLN